MVFERVKGELVSNLKDTLNTQESYKIVNGAFNILKDLDKHQLSHGDIRLWNFMYDMDTSKVSLIDFDHA
jgi:O-antigen chain-terminating methyltransferase